MLLITVPAAFQMPSASCLSTAACVSLTPFCRQAKTLSPYFFSAVWRRAGGTCCASVTCLSRPALHIMYEQEEYVVLSFPCPKASTSELYNGVSVPGRRSFPLSVVPMLDRPTVLDAPSLSLLARHRCMDSTYSGARIRHPQIGPLPEA